MEFDKRIKVYDNQGNEKEFEMLFTYEHEERGHKYVFFVDSSKDDEIICMRYDDDGNLFEIEDDDEYNEMDEVLQAYLEDPAIQELKKGN